METYADELRKLADLLDNDFSGNLGNVIKELLRIIRTLFLENYME